jgi:hypothetical protein
VRKRHAAAMIAAVGLTVSVGAWVHADTTDDSTVPHPVSTQPAKVTLPTGDQVRISGDGVLVTEPGSNFYSPRVAGGDRLMIPFASLDEVRSGELDARLFNVDALLRSGINDARDVSDASKLRGAGLPSEMDDAAETTKVTLQYSWLDGSPAKSAGGYVMNLDTKERQVFGAVDGVATLDLVPGKYSVAGDMDQYDTAPQQVIATIFDFEVAEKPVELEVDGQQSRPVKFQVDREGATSQANEMIVYSDLPGGENGIGAVFAMNGDTELYALPSDKIAEHPTGLVLRSQLTNSAGAAEPFSYSLYATAEGIPDDPSFTVADEDLAVREVTYHSLGAESTMQRLNIGYNEKWPPTSYQQAGNVAVPAERTELYTADPEVEWSQLGTLYSGGEDDPFDDVLHHIGAVKQGTEEESWLSAPLSVGITDPTFPYYGSGIERRVWGDETNRILARMPMFSSGADGEYIVSWNLKGETVLSRDGEEIGKADNGSSIEVDVPKEQSGRYTVAFDATREVPWTPLGTRSTASWEFDSGPVSEDTVLDVSAVRFDAEGVVDGYAPAAEAQQVTLDFATQPGAADRSCAAMTLEVSYDDGKTWHETALDRDGDHAAATLEHPSGATFVSIRITAEDDKDRSLEQTTIRSYGLK